MGSIDAQGIWQYDGTDQMIPHAAYSNLLAVSVSNAIGAIQTELDSVVYETGTFSPGGGTTDGDVHLWRRGEVCGMEYTSRIGTATHGVGLGTIAAEYRPPYTVTIPLTPNSPNPNHAFIQISSLGVVNLYMYGSTTGTTLIRGSASWPKNL